MHVNKDYFLFSDNSSSVRKLITWKHSFSRLNEEYELAEKKRQALGSLLEAGKISQTTYNLFAHEIDEAVAEIDGQRKALTAKMTSKAMELEDQIRTLEILLANFEIQHVAGEVDDDEYHLETELLGNGLTVAKKELDDVQCAVNQLTNDELNTQQVDETPQIQAPEPEATMPQEPLPTAETEQAPPVEAIAETVQCKEEAQPSQPETKPEEQTQA